MTVEQNTHKGTGKNIQNIHGTGLIFNGYGVLIRGDSGAGKSLLALALLETAHNLNIGAFLIGDDRLNIFNEAGELIMSGPETLRGKIELSGYGIIDRAFVESAPINLVVDIVSELVRMPEERAMTTSILGINLPRCPVAKNRDIGLTHQRMIVVEAINNLRSGALEKKT